MRFLKRPRPGGGGASSASSSRSHNGGLELSSNGTSGGSNAGANSRREPLVGAESKTQLAPQTDGRRNQGNASQNDYYHQMPPQDLPTGERKIPKTKSNPGGTNLDANTDMLLSVASSGSMPPLRVPSRTVPNAQVGFTAAGLHYNQTDGSSSSQRRGQNNERSIGGGKEAKAAAANGATLSDEEEANNIYGDDDEEYDDDDYSRYSSNYLADHNCNFRENEALNDAKYPPPSPGGRRSAAAGASYDRNRSMSDYTAPFDDTEEWTPDDSAYGAACPVFGWIPKPIRKIIEATFIFVLVLIFVVVVISASIKMSNDKNSGRSGKTGNWNSSGSGGGNKWYADGSTANNNNNKGNSKQDDQQQEMGDDYYVEHDGENDDNTDDYINGDNNGDGANNNSGRGRFLLRRNHVVVNGVMLEGGAVIEKTRTGGDLLERRVGKTYLW